MADHTTPKTPTAATAIPPAAGRRFGAFGPSTLSLMSGLYERAAPNLSPDDLRHLAGQADPAGALVGHIATVCNALGCMVATDDVGGSGSFQSTDDLSSLLFMLASVAGFADGLLQVAQAAECNFASQAGSAQ